MNKKLLHVGLDVGSTTVKIVIMNDNLETIYTNYRRHFSDTKNTVCDVLEELAKEKNIQFKAVRLKSREEAQSAPTPITTYALFCDGEYITNEQMNDKRFLKLISQ